MSEKEIAVADVIVDHDFRLRPLTESVVSDYVNKLKAADGEWPFGSLKVVLHDGKYYCADGGHRHEAARLTERPTVVCDVVDSDGHIEVLAEQVFMSNHSHGLRRSNADKRRAVRMALDHFPDRSNRETAFFCSVSPGLVASVRQEIEGEAAGTPEIETLPDPRTVVATMGDAARVSEMVEPPTPTPEPEPEVQFMPEPTQPTITDPQPADFRLAFESGFTNAEIAEQFGQSHEYVMATRKQMMGNIGDPPPQPVQLHQPPPEPPPATIPMEAQEPEPEPAPEAPSVHLLVQSIEIFLQSQYMVLPNEYRQSFDRIVETALSRIERTE